MAKLFAVMFSLVYASTAVEPFSGDELLALLEQAREKNARLGLTGLLLYKHGAFMQMLEGEEAVVSSLYARICRDPRHHQLLILLEAPAYERLFADWSMGFENLGSEPLGPTPGYNPSPKFAPYDDNFPWKTSVAMRLLAGFTQRT